MPDIINLEVVPYGNTAYDSSTDSFTCQHGDGECQSDTLESCVMFELNGKNSDNMFAAQSYNAWPFILCMEEAEGNPTQGESCYTNSMLNANATSIEWSTISDCAINNANTVQTAAMKATPDHDYVPWVLVNGNVVENSNALQKAICDAYTGSNPPLICQHMTKENYLEEQFEISHCKNNMKQA